MTLKQVSKDMGELHARLFDHRPVILSEITYFVKEFEEKRQDREYTRLQKTHEHIRELDESIIPKAKEDLEKSLAALSANLSTAVQMSQMVLEREKDENKDNWIRENRAVRVKKWSAFMDQMCEESAKVDNQFEEELASVQKYYRDLEQSLHMAK